MPFEHPKGSLVQATFRLVRLIISFRRAESFEDHQILPGLWPFCWIYCFYRKIWQCTSVRCTRNVLSTTHTQPILESPNFFHIRHFVPSSVGIFVNWKVISWSVMKTFSVSLQRLILVDNLPEVKMISSTSSFSFWMWAYSKHSKCPRIQKIH